MGRLGMLFVVVGTVCVGAALYDLLTEKDFTLTFLTGVVLSAVGTLMNTMSRDVEQ
jgi:hypothetical protein